MGNGANTFFPEFIGESFLPMSEAVADQVPAGVYVLQRGRFEYVNEGTCELLGYDDPARLSGQLLWPMVHPDDRRRVRLNSIVPFRMFKMDGTQVWVAMQGVLAAWAGKPAQMGYIVDMSVIRYLNRALKKNRARINHVEDAIAELDLDGNIVSYTEAARKVWRISNDEYVGRNHRSLMPPAFAEKVGQAYRKVYETGRPDSNIVYEIISENGQNIVVEDSVALIRDQAAHPIGFRIVSRDITRQKETERKSMEHQARLEAIFRSVKDAIITVGPDMTIIDANDAAKSICGLDLQAAAGVALPQALDHCSASCVEVLRRTLAQRKSIQDYRVECRHEKCGRQIADVSSAALLDAENNFIGAVMVIRDKTHLQELERELRPRDQYQNIIGKSRGMQAIYHLLEDLADLQTTVLITGESGTGKSLIAGALHRNGRGAAAPYVTVNCSALAETLLESELFGHVRGAFTGAFQDKVGRFEAADGGTLLVDEIGDISPLIQLKLLRVLQEKEFERVGESVSRKVNVRVIACTNKDLRQKVARGEFREDLFYRLKVVEIHVPPLRERMEDVPLLIEHFRKEFNVRFGKKIDGVSDDVLARLMDYPWPGNVRELEHVIEHAFVYCDGRSIRMPHVPPEIRKLRGARKPLPAGDVPGLEDTPHKILVALNDTHWNRNEAARLLGISRQTLYRKMKKYQFLGQGGD
jgi:PAS domain S-box-containing protein